MRRGRELLAGLLLASIGIVFALGVLELGIRMLHLVPDRFWEPDPILGVRLIPGDRGWWTQEDREFVVPVQINHQGLRDVEHAYAKAPGVFRILVLGDSFVEAMQVPLETVFTRLLEQQLNRDGASPQVEVVSAGVSGYGTAGELLYFEREGKRYQPDVVLLAFYPGNDVKNCSPTLEEKLKPVYAADGTLQRVTGETPRKAVKGWRRLLAHSAAYHYFRQVLLVRHPDLAKGLVRHGLLRTEAVRTATERNGVPIEYGVYAPEVQPEWQDAWQHTEDLLEQLHRSVTANGARLVVAVLSGRDQVYPQWWDEIVRAHPGMQGKSWDLDVPQRRIEAWCAAHGVSCVSLAPAFRAAVARGEDALYYHHDGHWTASGHRLAATVLADFLKPHQPGADSTTRSGNEAH